MTVAVLVVSLPERHSLLIEALDSVDKQTVQPETVLVGIDNRIVGEAENMNRLARAADVRWLALLHDDDLWEPHHLEELLAHSTDADVVVASFDTPGRPSHTIEAHHCDYGDLRRTNWFPPSAVMVRSSIFHMVGGFTEEPAGRWTDWTMWKRLLDGGARFACSHEVTMHYRFGDWGNGSWRVS